MLNVRSRATVAGVTTGAAVLLALPVVAAGQVPVVDQVVGGVQEAAQEVAPAPAVPALPAPAPALPAPPVNVPAPPVSAPAPKPQGSAPAPAAPAPAAPAPSAQRQSAPSVSTSGGGDARASGSSSKRASSADGGSKDRSGRQAAAASASQSGGATAGASQEEGGGPTDVEIASGAAEAPEDASPATLPFTGLQLALLGALGLAALMAGVTLRRGARGAG